MKSSNIYSKNKDINRLQFRTWMVLIPFMFLASSCEDLLEENPRTIAAENFYNTEEEVRSAVNAIYSPLRMEMAEQFAILDTHTDWGYGRGSRAQYNDFEGFNAGNINATTVRWNAYYLSIRNANLVLRYAPEGSSISEEALARNIGEAKFLRALAYFDLVRNWGGVPMRMETNLDQLDLSKSSEEEIFELIISDLTDAEQKLPEVQQQIGRPTQNAAKTLLAHVYLTLNRFDEARTKAAEVINSERHSLVRVTSVRDFQVNLFGPDLTTTTEEIFHLKYAREVAQGNWLLWIVNHPSTNLYNFGGAFAHYALSTDPFYANWQDGDLRKALWIPVDFGMGPNTLVTGKFIDNQAISNRGAGNDLPIYRYSDVLLMFAEASSRAANSPTEEALDALNQVQRRAYGLDPNVASDIDFQLADYDSESFLDLILTERAYEFQFEGKRWLDLKRTGKAASVIQEGKGRTIAEKHYLWPIPFEELNLNKGLDPTTDQNPGY
ncbi:RagB/SusD family nutrient uptake outer membrane protein [Belliella sp. R4-6]|uniref:RagB/SusD family nutrient uptake outer membrane protein n=1 Tax=Belliella alkalica TaxID=1730871 RepID=A0ABS9VAT6_9BACT|nr:RagB/SusD family nutrient uptake outer membrane protein [Belliella alkalica]MCH7413552.1 RagB/SusD family nutrient uptake outer membrane protein [Belliella alkalica]